MKFDRDPWEAMSVDMTPLVDCIFAIILFLLVVSSWVESMEQDLSIELPTQGKALKVKPGPSRPIIVNVGLKGDGAAYYRVGGFDMDLTRLRGMFSQAKVRDPEQAVIIRGDRRLPWEHVASVFGCCAEVGISKVSARVAIQENQQPR